MLNVMLRILAWVSITLVTTISANPIPDLVRDEKGFTRLNYDLATVLDPSRLLSVEDKMLGRRLRGLPVPPRETTMRHFCLPSPRRNPACVRCDDLYTRPVSDEHFAKCATNQDGMGCTGRTGRCTTMDALRMHNGYAIQVGA